MYKLHNTKVVSIGLSILSAVFAVSLVAYATSIGTNLSIDGTATVTGASTFTGAVTTNGNLQASSTALFTNGITTYAGSTFGSASTDVNLFTGRLQASTTALFTSGLTAYGNIVTSSANVGVSTSTPAQALSVAGNVFVGSGATSTMFLTSTLTTAGGCIEMRSAKGVQYRMYVGPSDIATSTGTTGGNRPAATLVALWEPGSCQ